MIRFNTTASRFEGYNGTGWTGLGGVIDLDQDTYIIPESTPGADEDVLFFYAAGAERMRLTAAGNIGIGTTSPDSLLTVYSDGSKTGPLFHVATSSTDALYH